MIWALSSFIAYHDNFDLTKSLTMRPSAAFPARRANVAFMTAPISFIVEAPVSTTAAATASSISAGVAACGR